MGRRFTEKISARKVQARRAAKARSAPRASDADLREQLKRRTAELTEARQRQTATADVLKVISRSTFDVQTVLQTLTESAAHLCNADMATITRQGEPGQFYHGTNYNFPPDWVEYTKAFPLKAGRGTVVGRTLLDKRAIQIPDVLADPEYTHSEQQKKAGYRTFLGVPLLREGRPIGVFCLCRRTVRPFTKKQIELVTTFADQAVIAIENVRLFEQTNEALRKLEVRSSELAESLQHQTATSQILSVISSSRADIQPVFDAIVNSAARLFEPCGATITTLNDGQLHWNATAATLPDFDIERAKAIYPIPFDPERAPSARALLERRIIEIPDIAAPDTPEFTRKAAAAGGFRSVTFAPLIKQDKGIGTIILTHQRAGFKLSEKQLALVRTFADQAVIAIENVRLFDEVEAKTRDLEESLQQQTATADVLKVISRSAFDLDSVLSTLVTSAARLCGAERGLIFLREGNLYRMASNFGFSPELEAFARANPLPADGTSTTARAGAAGAPVQAVDLVADKTQGEMARAYQRLGGHKTNLGVPLRRDSETIGVFTLTRQVVQAFTPRQIELVKTFADQAVIAIENARLFEEVQAKTRDLTEALTYQTGSANILNIIASSPTDVAPVLKAIVESACDLCEAYDAVVMLKDGDELSLGAHHGPLPMSQQRWSNDRTSISGRAMADRRPVHVHDVLSDEGADFAVAREMSRVDGCRTLLGAPLLRESESIGAIVLRRAEAHPFSDKQIALLQTFADQAVIAIGNVRLFEEVQARTHELTKSLEDLRTAQDRLIQTEKLASLGQLTAGIAHEIKNPLNFVNNFAALSVDLTDELTEMLNQETLTSKGRENVDEVTGLLRDNLGKVVQHGKRADSIVKNMLMHSREGSGERRSADVNALVAESLNLAYHGARAEKADFSITLEHDFDPNAGALELYPQEITRALLNLISNGFYAATRRKAENGNGAFEPVLSAATRNLGETVEIRIRDNGPGIPPEVREKMFNPFFTTKPTGEGTGLGLSMTHDIIVKQHGGRIDVETKLGEFTEFIITLPRDNGVVVAEKSE